MGELWDHERHTDELSYVSSETLDRMSKRGFQLVAVTITPKANAVSYWKRKRRIGQ